MKNKPYKVTGDDENGFRIAIQQGHGVKKGDRYAFSIVGLGHKLRFYLPDGAIVYVPVVKP